MKSYTLLIGNSDDKLSQSAWHDFVGAVEATLDRYGAQIHFAGAPESDARWQNYAWVFEYHKDKLENMKRFIGELRGDWKQTSAIWIEGQVEFI